MQKLRNNDSSCGFETNQPKKDDFLIPEMGMHILPDGFIAVFKIDPVSPQNSKVES
jgi:hypothetical protein